MKKAKLIIICATQRCGSTMIVDDFRCTGVLGNPEEYFIPWEGQSIIEPEEEFKKIIQRASTSNEVATIKVMANQLEHIERNLANASRAKSKNVDDIFPHCKELFKAALFIRVERLDIVSQAISRHVAYSTGKYHHVDNSSDFIPGNSVSSNKAYNAEVKFNRDKINKYVLTICKERALWANTMKNWGREFDVTLVYEECVNDRGFLEDICSLLSVENQNLRERKLKKLGNSLNDELIRDYYSSSSSKKENNVETTIEDAHFLRDTALDLQRININKAHRLMEIASKLKPGGVFIKQKLADFSEKLN